MKLLPVLTFYLVLVVGCATNEPMLLKSVVGTRDLITTSPSLSMSKDSVVRWATIGYGDATDLTGFLTEGDLAVKNHYIAGGGVMVQPDLSPDFQFGPFVGIAAAGSYSNIGISPGVDSRTILDSQSVPYRNQLNSIELESNVKPGLVGKFYIGTLSVFGLGYFGYEGGSYPKFRQTYDGVGNLYNVDANPVTWGYGLGTDLQLGASEVAAVGLGVHYLWSYNQTQSFVTSRISADGSTYLVDTKNGGIQTVSRGPAFSPYLEIKNFRLTASVALFSLSDLQLSYRW